MKRRVAWRLGGAVALVLAACRSPAAETTVFQVARGPFVHKVTAEGNLRAKESTKISVPPTVRRRVRLAWIAREGALLEAGDLVARFDAKDFEQNLEVAVADLAGTRHDMTRTEAESGVKEGRYQRDFEVADLELDFAERFELTDDSIFSRHEIAEDAIDQELTEARRTHAAEMSGIQRQLTQTELAILEIERRKANLKIEEARAGLGSLEVRAPHRGILTLIRNWRGDPPAVGSEMWRGQEIGELPALDTMEAEVFVLEADAAGLAEGKAATVIVEAHPETARQATVTRVDPIAKPRFPGSPVQYFGATLSFEATDAATMKPGQRVVATLYIEELEETFVVPRQAVFQEGDTFWVYRKNGGGYDDVPVTIAASSAALVAIASGLEPGDEVALGRPAGAEDAPRPPNPGQSQGATSPAGSDAP
ncbi:MAG: HlyD family efflux transporter periplasmic adaptor subunit [Acidobacteriota bacterium]|nr:HlyD family efflux transporter periplasmic adaptor subunit [Acidobacteriota bacterium]MDH3524751.1 HlyD family efflux transporter periplasmic adaptor subunit [Acidobacteriota bacterium]